MFYVLSKILDLAFEPLVWALVLVAFAVPWSRRWRRRRWRRRRRFGLAAVVLVLVMSTEHVGQALLASLEDAAPDTYRHEIVYDAVILLGGVTDERVEAARGQPAYNDNVERLVAVHRILADGRAKVAIVSGAAMSKDLVPYGEARSLARQLRAWGIPEANVILEEEAKNTRENAVFTERIVRERGFSRVLVVTSAFHMLRARECYAAVGLPVDTLRVDYRSHAAQSVLPRASNLHVTTYALREIIGRLVYRLQGYARAL
jgi:uncharacterized SAM-binding protein YcdF (DUF218 family)